MRALQWLKARLSERSTWAGIVGGITGAAMLPEPWNWLALAAGTVMSVIPEKEKP